MTRPEDKGAGRPQGEETYSSAFQDIRVLDLSDRISGAFAARLFGDFGADVVLAEMPEGHALRREPPFLNDQPGPERSVLHAYLNWNKRSTVIEKRIDLDKLVDAADIVITNADPIELAWFAKSLKALRPQAIHLSITPHGLASPLSGHPGNDLTASGRTGWSYINRLQDEPPLQMPRHQARYIGGVAGFIAAAAALRTSREQGAPELIDVSEVEAFALTVHPWAVAAVYERTGFSDGPAGGRRRGEPGPLWEAADGQVTFGFADFRNWGAAMEVLHLPDLARRPELITDIHRHSQDLSEVVAGAARTLMGLERWPVFHALAKLRCITGVVQDIEDLTHDPHLAARRFFVQTKIAGHSVSAPGPVARLTPCPWRLKSPAPRLGEHTSAINAQNHAARGASPALSGRDSGGTRPEGPLRGVRVLSLAQAWSGTFGTELLAFLGADVVQVSSIHRNDVWRRVRNQVPAGLVDPSRVQHPLNTQGLYNSVNLNKREITLDLRKERGKDLFWQLLPHFDVLADNFRPTVLPSWGITLEKLQELRPGVIWASISGYGTDGPYWDYPATGATTEPMAGLSSLHGYEGDHGMNTGGLYPDPVAGYFFAAAVVAALAHRDRTGQPQRIDLSMMEAVATVCGDAVVEYGATGRVPRPWGNYHPRIAPHNNYQTRNGEWLALTAETEEAWLKLRAFINDERLKAPRFADMVSRKAHEPELDAIISRWCGNQDAEQAEEALAKLGVAAARVVPLYELYSQPSPNFVASGFLTKVEHPEAGATWLPGAPWKFSSAPRIPIRPAPCVGEHSREVLREEIGIGDDEYQELVEGGITGTLDDFERAHKSPVSRESE